MRFDPLFVNKPHPRIFSKMMGRLRPALLDLQQRISALDLADEPITQIVACLCRGPETPYLVSVSFDPPFRFYFVSNFGDRWTYRPIEDQKFAVAVASILLTGVARSPVNPLAQAVLSACIRDWMTAFQQKPPESPPG